ncbi:MAG: hypothetical protein HOP29_03755 [Phycisphaerales bacterium]|nr:hypothetical protein [Phycisphaerales bacterium]
MFASAMRWSGHAVPGTARWARLAVSACWAFGPAAVLGQAFEPYGFARRVELPTGAGPIDALPDGRLIALLQDDVYVQNCFDPERIEWMGTLPDADLASFGAAFVRVSPDGTRIAVGNNGGASLVDFEVGVFELPGLAGVWFTGGHFDANWYDDTLLALTAGDFVNPGVVTMLDTASPIPGAPVNTVVVDNIGGGSGGVTFDAVGNLYTGNGFALFGPSDTGHVRAFDFASWSPALSGGMPVDFEVDGVLIIDALSASPLHFDASGNLLIGGGDFSGGDIDAVAVVDATAVADALGGFGPANVFDATQVQRLDPDTTTEFNFYGVVHNPGTDEVLVTDGPVHAFAPRVCESSGDCDDAVDFTDDYCTAEGICLHVPAVRGDTACATDGTVDIFDILAVLDAFAGTSPCCD